MSRLGKAAAATAATLALTVIPAARASADVPNSDPLACTASGDHWVQLAPAGPLTWFEYVGEYFAAARHLRYWHIVDNPVDNQYVGGFAVTCDLSTNAETGFADLTVTADTLAAQPTCGHADFTTATELSKGYIISDYHLVGERTSRMPGTPPTPQKRYTYWGVYATIHEPPLPDAVAAVSDSARCPANAAGTGAR